MSRPQDWPGATSVEALLDGSALSGVWYDRTAEYWARKRGEEVEPGRFAAAETLRLHPLPCWEELPREEVEARIGEIVDQITAETRRRHRRAKSRPLGVQRILRQDPHHRPRRVARSAAPRFHAASWQIRRRLEEMYRSFRDAYRDAMETLRSRRLPVRFPSPGIPPPVSSLAAQG